MNRTPKQKGLSRKILALLLTACMVMTMTSPAAAAAVPGTETPAAESAQESAATVEEPTAAPEEPTAAPEEPTVAPEEPTVAPEEPTAAPEEPTAAPEEPTAAPEESTAPAPTMTPVPATPTPSPSPSPSAEPVTAAVEKLIALIDALPTMDEWTAMEEAPARTVMDKILAAKKAYDALTDEEKALIDEMRTKKLLELAEMAEQLADTMSLTPKAGSLSEVYLSGSAGSGGNGSSDAPVQTFAQAKNLLAENGTIYISGTITVVSDESWDLSDMGTAKILRAPGFQNSLIHVKSGTLTLSDIVLDGNKDNVSNVSSVITLVTGKVILNSGAIVRNNNNSGIYATTGTAGPSFILGAEIVMNEGSAVSGNQADNGGGVKLAYDAQLSLKGGVVSGNSATNSGGGVHAGISSKIVMSSGSISDNYCGATGGGVYLEVGHLASDNTQDQSSASFDFNGGNISGNTAEGDGGGVYLLKPFISDGPTFKMTSGSITDNTSGKNGGGIAAMGGSSYKTVLSTIYGGSLSGNKAVTGGGVYLGSSGQLALKNCTITGNSAQTGGGVFHVGSILQLQETVTVTGNTRKDSAIPSNVHLDAYNTTSLNKKINVAGDIKGAIGISSKRIPSDKTGFDIVQAAGGHTITAAEAALFSSDDNAYTTELSANGKVYLKRAPLENIYLSSEKGSDDNDGSTPDTAVKTFEKAFELVRAGGTIFTKDFYTIGDTQTWGSEDKPGITVKRAADFTDNMFWITSEGALTLKNITIDAAIRDADGSAMPDSQSAAPVFQVDGSLVMDTGSVVENNNSSATGSGVQVERGGSLLLQGDASIRNNKVSAWDSGGGVYAIPGSTVTIQDSASITGNSATYDGGGIYSAGNVYIRGGSVTNNTAGAEGYGGGIYCSGLLEISDGTVSDNYAGKYGGGVFCAGNSQITGGTITENSAAQLGGGIFYGSTNADYEHIIGNCALTNNTAKGEGVNPVLGKGNNAYINNNDVTVSDTAFTHGGVFLNKSNGTSKLILKAAQNSSVVLEGIYTDTNPLSGSIVAEGDGYTLTKDDLSKFTCSDEGVAFQLDADNNQIKMYEFFTVTFDVNGGDDSIAPQKILSGNKAAMPKDPTKTGYSFDGWYQGTALFHLESTPITGNITLEAKWTVISVSGVSLDKTSATLVTGETEDLIATVSPTNAANKSVTWKSSNESVATVENGTVTAVDAGTAIITVTTVDGNKTDTCTVTVNKNDAQCVVAAKEAIVDGKVTVTFGADQTAKTAAVQTYVDNLLAAIPDAAGVTATVTYNGSTAKYDVALSKGSVNDSKSITMTVNIGGISGTCSWSIDAAGTLTIYPTNGSAGKLDTFTSAAYIPWKDNLADVKKVLVKPGVQADYKIISLFSNLVNCTAIDLSGLDTANTESMAALFYGCAKLTDLTLGNNFSTANVTDMSGMFNDCKKLTALDISSFNTAKVKNANNLFVNMESLTKITLGNAFSSGTVTAIGGMFTGCSSLEALDLSKFNTSNVTAIKGMFKNCSKLSAIDLSSFTNTKATSMNSLFEGCSSLETIVFGADFSTEGAKSMNAMFKNCAALKAIDVSGLNTAKVSDMLGMFEGCTKLATIDVSTFDTSTVTDMDKMFKGCASLTALDLSGFSTDKLQYTNSMFDGCTLGLDTSFLKANMNAKKIYLYGKSSKDDLTTTDLNGNEENIVYKPYAITKEATVKGSYTVSSDGEAESYFTKTAPFYGSGAPSYDSTKSYGQLGKTVTITLSPDNGYELDTLTVTSSGGTIATSGKGNTRTFTMPKGNVTVAVTFKVSKCAVTLHGNGGSGTALTEYTPGTAATLPTDWTKTNYTFKGWYDNAAFNGDSVAQIPTTATGAKAFWAKWADEEAPTISVATPPTDWQKENVSLTVTFADSVGVTELYVKQDGGAYTEINNFGTCPYTYTASAEGEHTYQFRAEDAAGNTTESIPVTVKLDKTAPANVGITYEKTGSDLLSGFMRAITFGSFFNEAVKVNVLVTDAAGGSGVNGAKVEYQTVSTTADETEPTSGWQTATLDADGQFSFAVDKSFKGLVWVRGYDVAGNFAVNHSDLTVENTPPTVIPPTNAPSADKWYDGTVSFILTASDDSGIDTVTVTDSIENGSTVTDHGDGSYTVTVTGNGTHRVQASIKDKAGNLSLLPADGYTVKIDDTIPSIIDIIGNLTGDNWTNKNITLTATPGTVGVSGQTITAIGPDGTVTVDADGKFKAVKNGDYTVTVTTGAGKTATKTVTVNRIDKTNPKSATITFDPDSPNGTDNWYTSLTLTATPPTADGGAPITTSYKLWKTGETEPAYTELSADGLPALTDGEYTLKVQTTDAAGNSSEENSYSFKLDTTAPTITDITGNLTGDNWTNEDITLTVTPGTAGVSGQTITASGPDGDVVVDSEGKFTAEKNGEYTVTVTTGAGKTVTETITVDRIDKTAPANATVSFNPASPNGTDSWHTSLSLTAIAPAADGGAPITTSYKLWTKGETEPAYTELPAGGLPALTDGEYTLKVQTTDAAGNSSAESENSFKLDTVSPVVDTANIGEENGNVNFIDWIIGKKSLILTIPVTDATSGVDSLSYTTTPDSGSPISNTATLKDGKYEIALGVEFSGIIKVIATDKAGNQCGETSLTANDGKIVAEDTAPTITITEPTGKNAAGWHKQAFNLTVTVQDDKDSAISGGIANIVWKEGADGTEQSLTDLPGASPVTSKQFTIPVTADGEHTYYINATDNAGNTAAQQTISVKLDSTTPTITGITGNLSGDDWTNGDISLTVTPGTAGISGQTITATGPDGDVAVDEDGKFTATENGSYTVTVTTGAGKTVTQTVTVDRIDKTAPANATVSFNPASPNGTDSWYTSLSLTATAPAADGGAPITTSYKLWTKGETEPSAYTELPAGGLPALTDGEYTLKMQTTDRAGNSSAESENSFKLDTTAPTITEITGNLTGDNWTNEDITLTVTPGTAGVSGQTITASGPDGDVVVDSEGKFTAEKNGEYTVTVTTGAGKTATQIVTVNRIDKTAPANATVSFNPASPNGTDSWHTSLSLTAIAPAVDGGAPITTSYKLWKTGETEPAYTELPAGGLPALTDGEYTLKMQTTDAAGNSSAESENSFKLDTVSPVVDTANIGVENGSVNFIDWIIGKKSLILTIPVTDATSGVDKLSYTATPDSGSPISNTATLKDGKYEIALGVEFSGIIKVIATDKAGNQSGETSLTANDGRIVAEDTAPIITITEPEGKNAAGWHKQAFNLTVDVADSGTSGGIKSIVWKEGTDGTEQTIADLPGSSPITSKSFTIPVTADGEHSYYINATDNAGNTAAQQTITVKLDTTAPGFTVAPVVKDITDSGAAITLTPNEGGTLYLLLDPAAKPSALEIKADGRTQEVTGGTEAALSLTELTPGIRHNVFMVLEDAAGNLSAVIDRSFVTKQAAPEISLKDLSLDYKTETIALPTGTQAYTDPANPEGSMLTADTTGKITVTPGNTIYVRYPEKTVDGETVSPSPETAVTLPSRPQAPGDKLLTHTDTTVTVNNVVSGEEYVLVQKGESPHWEKANTTGEFTGLSPNTEYILYARLAAVLDNCFASLPSQTPVKTLVTIDTLTISGDGAGKAGNTVQTPATPNADGTILYKGSYSKDYTPSLVIGGTSYTPILAWDTDSGTGTWEYSYTVQSGDGVIKGDVQFNPRKLTEITAKNAELFADNAANTSAATLKAWLDTNQRVDASYDNKVTEAKAAAYNTADSFEPTGKFYAYTAVLDGKTALATLTVKPVTAAVTAPADITKMRNAAKGYTQAQLGLPEHATVNYTGNGYTAKTETLPIMWANENLPADFGKTVTEKVFTGTIAFPAWATVPGGVNTSVKVNIIDQTPLTDDQMELSLPGWNYGEKKEPTPTGSIVPSDTNGIYAYSYSADGGNTWVEAEKLPKSTAGNLKAGTYTVKMEYLGELYAGTKTAAFTVAAKELTLTAGTLAVTTKAYDGNTAAILTGTPAITGTVKGDTVAVDGYTGIFARADAETNIPVTVTGFTPTGADKDNYTLKANTSLALTGTITTARGEENPAYSAALAELQRVHIITNVTQTLETVKLPQDWQFTADTTKRLTASNDNNGQQHFGVQYSSKDTNYEDVALNHAFPVSFVSLEVTGGLDMRTIDGIGETLIINPITLKVVGAPLPNEGEYATSNMEWRSSCPGIAEITGDVISDSQLEATIKSKATGVSMVGVAYKNGGNMLGYILIQVADSHSSSSNSIGDIKEITDTLSSLIDPENPSETDTKAVNAVADEVTKLPEDAKRTLIQQDVKSLDELKQAVNSSLNIQIIEDAEGTPPLPEAVSIVGAAIASGVESGTVKVFVTPVVPSENDTKLELRLEMEVDGNQTQLKSPLFFSVTLPEYLDISKLEILHITKSGVEKVTFSVNERTVSFMLLSFSGLRFNIKGDEPENTPTPKPEATPTPEPGTTPTPKPEATPTPEPGTTSTPKPETTPTPEPGTTSTPKPEATPTPEPGTTSTPKPEATPTPEPETTPTQEPGPTPSPRPSTGDSNNPWIFAVFGISVIGLVFLAVQKKRRTGGLK